jgi:hypothetical protein
MRLAEGALIVAVGGVLPTVMTIGPLALDGTRAVGDPEPSGEAPLCV